MRLMECSINLGVAVQQSQYGGVYTREKIRRRGGVKFGLRSDKYEMHVEMCPRVHLQPYSRSKSTLLTQCPTNVGAKFNSPNMEVYMTEVPLRTRVSSATLKCPPK